MELAKDNLIELINNENKVIQKSQNRILELEKVMPLIVKNSKFLDKINKIIEFKKVENIKNANEIIQLIDKPFKSSYSNSYYLGNSKVIDKYFEENTDLINHIKNENYYNNKKTEFENALELQRQIEQEEKDIEKLKNDTTVAKISIGILVLLLILDEINEPSKWYNYILGLPISILIFVGISMLLNYISNSIRRAIYKNTLNNLERKHIDLISVLKNRDY